MRIIIRSGVWDNAHASVNNLISLLNIKISATSLNQLRYHKEYPSLLSISDCLNDWKIENLAINSSVSQLKEIPYPSIAHLKKNNGHFVVLQKLENELLHYMDPEIGIIEESLEEFEKKWTGVVLLVQANEKSGEENYREKRAQEVFQRVSSFAVLGLLAILLVLPIPFFTWQIASIYSLKFMGGVLSYFLLQKQFGGSNAIIDAFCKTGYKSDCDAAIHSPASRAFGFIHLSEIGAWYFAGGLLSIVIGVFSLAPMALPLFVLAVLPLPFSLFAAYYQGWVIKKWCPLCLAVLGVVWLEFAANLSFGSFLPLTLNSLAVVILGFSLPLIFWFSIRKRFFDSFNVEKLQRNLNRFLKSERIFQKLLEDQPLLGTGYFSNEIQTEPNEPLVTLTVVNNPDCGPCAHAHVIVEDLVDRFDGKLKVVFRFAVNSMDTKSMSYEMLSHLIALQMNSTNEEVLRALSSWYLKNGSVDIKKWKEENPILLEQDPQTVGAVIAEHAEWCAKVGITATPTILINGKTLPEEFSINDLKYQLRKLLEKMNEPEPVS